MSIAAKSNYGVRFADDAAAVGLEHDREQAGVRVIGSHHRLQAYDNVVKMA